MKKKTVCKRIAMAQDEIRIGYLRNIFFQMNGRRSLINYGKCVMVMLMVRTVLRDDWKNLWENVHTEMK